MWRRVLFPHRREPFPLPPHATDLIRIAFTTTALRSHVAAKEPHTMLPPLKSPKRHHVGPTLRYAAVQRLPVRALSWGRFVGRRGARDRGWSRGGEMGRRRGDVEMLEAEYLGLAGLRRWGGDRTKDSKWKCVYTHCYGLVLLEYAM